jgi:hypothetical protein
MLRRGFILAENFRQPAALIGIHHQGSANHPGNLDFQIDSFPFDGGATGSFSAI